MRSACLEYLHTACNGFAPDSKAQRGFSKIRREMEELKLTDEEIAKHMAAALQDGLAYGNWPNGD